MIVSAKVIIITGYPLCDKMLMNYMRFFSIFSIKKTKRMKLIHSIFIFDHTKEI